MSDELRSPVRQLLVAGGLVLMALMFASETQGDEQGSGNATAEELMVRAHAARATWGEDFPGFSADVRLSRNSQRVAGRLTVTADGEVQLDIPESFDAEWAQRQLDSLVQHRQAGSDREYNVSFADDETTHPLGRLIKFNEDRLHSIYRIKGDVITEVHRTMGDQRFTISVLGVTRNAEGKYLPRTYSVSFWEAGSGDLKTSSTVQDTWKRVRRFDLPARILTVTTEDGSERDVKEIRISGHVLLES